MDFAAYWFVVPLAGIGLTLPVWAWLWVVTSPAMSRSRSTIIARRLALALQMKAGKRTTALATFPFSATLRWRRKPMEHINRPVWTHLHMTPHLHRIPQQGLCEAARRPGRRSQGRKPEAESGIGRVLRAACGTPWCARRTCKFRRQATVTNKVGMIGHLADLL